MMSITHPAKTIVVACITALALAACGGSDSGSASGASGAASGMSTGFSGQDASAPVLTNNVANDGFARTVQTASTIAPVIIVSAPRATQPASPHLDTNVPAKRDTTTITIATVANATPNATRE